MNTPLKRGVFFLPTFGLILGCLLSYHMDPSGEGAKLALRTMVSIFAITSGIVLATIILLGDPKNLLPGSAKRAYWQIKSIRGRMTGLSLLFSGYITVMTLVVTSYILVDTFPRFSVYLSHSSVVLGITALVCSLRAPFIYLSVQESRLSSELKERQEKDEQELAEVSTVQ